MATLEERIIARDATIAVLGLGYVGLPLAVEFAESGFTVSGVDLDVQKVATLNAGGSYVADVPAERVAPLVRRGRLRAVTDYTQACRHGDGTRRKSSVARAPRRRAWRKRCSKPPRQAACSQSPRRAPPR